MEQYRVIICIIKRKIPSVINNKKSKRSPKERGKRWYNFDFQFEKAIYDYLCCKRVKKKMLRKLDENLKFESYQQWKQYVVNKYQKLSVAKLTEFSRFLNQEIRDLKPSHEYWSIMGSALMAVIFTNIIDVAVRAEVDFNGIPAWAIFIIIVFIEIVIVLLVLFCIVQTMGPIFDNSASEGLLRDYKEIIDGIISERDKVM